MNDTDQYMSVSILLLHLTKAEDFKIVGNKGIVQRRYG